MTDTDTTPCSTCRGNGIVMDYEAGTWDVCPVRCKQARDFVEQLIKGEEDIKAGKESVMSAAETLLAES